MGWRWVLYWPAIGCGFGFIILFFLMEETNFDRKTIGVVEITESFSSSTKSSPADPEKTSCIQEPFGTDVTIETVYKRKTCKSYICSENRVRPVYC